MVSQDKIQVEIWSDIQCPFCYIGKRQFEAALDQFPDKGRVEVTWRSFQLDPGLKAKPGETIYDYLARRKGMTVDQSKHMHDQVAQSARKVGLDYQFDKMIVSNSHAGHRIIQAAKAKGLGDRAEETLFKAYFTDGKDLGDRATMIDLAVQIGLTSAEAIDALDDAAGQWRKLVDDEASEAHALGSTGVPFFVFQRQYAVAGAQGQANFQKILEKVGRETLGN